jgi:CRP-like cAMP-binding protein
MGGCASSPATQLESGQRVSENGGRSFDPLSTGSAAQSSLKARARREGYSSGNPQRDEAPAALNPNAAPKTDKELECLRRACSEIVLFSQMTAKQQGEIFDHMHSVTCKTGECVIAQGEIGELLYVVETGRFDAFVRAKGDESVKTYQSGELFGELALMYNCPRAATVKCSSQGRLWGLSRDVYERVVRSTIEVRMDSKSQFLRSVELLSQLSEAEREALADVLEEVSYKHGEHLWKAGDPADCLILIKHGRVDVQEGRESETPGQNSTRLKDGAQLTVRRPWIPDPPLTRASRRAQGRGSPRGSMATAAPMPVCADTRPAGGRLLWLAGVDRLGQRQHPETTRPRRCACRGVERWC